MLIYGLYIFIIFSSFDDALDAFDTATLILTNADKITEGDFVTTKWFHMSPQWS